MAQLNISLSPEDLDQIRTDANAAGVSISRFVRSKVLDRPMLRDILDYPEAVVEGPTREEFDSLRADVDDLKRLAEREGAV